MASNVQMRVTSIYARLPDFDSDVIALEQSKYLERKVRVHYNIHPNRDVNRSAIINYLAARAAACIRSGRKITI